MSGQKKVSPKTNKNNLQIPREEGMDVMRNILQVADYPVSFGALQSITWWTRFYKRKILWDATVNVENVHTLMLRTCWLNPGVSYKAGSP